MNSKFIAKVVGVAMVLSFVVAGAAAPAQAVTVEELQAQIDALLAQLAALSGGSSSSSSSCYSYTADLTLGSTGPDVTALQTMLESKGFLVIPAGVSKGYFGPLTQSALASYQAANGISPAVGYFGPITRSHVSTNCTPTDGGSSNGGSTGSNELDGDFGVIDDVQNLSQYANEEVGDGEDDVTVLGFEVETSDDGDIDVTAIKVSFDSTGNTGSDNLDDYVDSVDIYLDGDMVGSADADEFSENGTVFSKTIALDDAIVDADSTSKFLVKVNAINNFDSADISGDSWTIDIDSVRFVDGAGAVTTDTSTGDINSMNVSIDFVSFSTAANTELKIKTESDSPEAGIVIVDETAQTDDVLLLTGSLEVEGTSDVTLDELPITLTTTGDSVGALTGSLKLMIDGEEYTESVGLTSVQTGTVTFDNLDLVLDAGDTYDFEIYADINDTNNSGVTATDFDEGDTLTASLTSTNRDYIDAENEEGDQLDDSSEKSGTAIGEAQEFRTSGIMLELVDTSKSVADGGSSNDDLGTVKLTFKVTAIGDTVYVSSLADAKLSGVTTGKTSVNVDRAGTATVGGVTVSIKNKTDTDLNSAGLFEIEEGDSETFELTTTISLPSAGDAGLFNVDLAGVSWSTSSTDETPDNAYTSNLDEFTEDVTLN